MRHGRILDRVWRQGDNKSDRPHKVPLTQLALDQIGKGDPQEFCFTGQRGEISGFSKLKRELDAACGVKGWTVHDLRRTFISGLGDLGFDEMTIKATVNHVTVTGALSHYMLAELEKQKTAALKAWADRLGKVLHAARKSRDRLTS